MTQDRNMYRTALARELRVGMAERKQIDLRDTSAAAVIVVFADELVTSQWVKLADSIGESAHFFVAPVDFTTGRLTMVTATHRRSELLDGAAILDSGATFGDLLVELRRQPAGARVGLAVAPTHPGESGITMSFEFGPVVEV